MKSIKLSEGVKGKSEVIYPHTLGPRGVQIAEMFETILFVYKAEYFHLMHSKTL